MNRKISTLCSALIVGLSVNAGGAVLLQWTPDGFNTGVITASIQDSSLAIVQQSGNDYVLGSGLILNGAADVDGANEAKLEWPGGNFGSETDFEEAVDRNLYFSLMIKADGAPLNISGFSFDLYRSGNNAPTLWGLWGLEDGDTPDFNTPLAQATITTTDSANPGTIAATGLDFNLADGESLELRVYAANWKYSSGSATVGGEVSGAVIPEPSSLALIFCALAVTALMRRKHRKNA